MSISRMKLSARCGVFFLLIFSIKKQQQLGVKCVGMSKERRGGEKGSTADLAVRGTGGHVFQSRLEPDSLRLLVSQSFVGLGTGLSSAVVLHKCHYILYISENRSTF